MRWLHMLSISVSPSASAYTQDMLTPAELIFTPAELIALHSETHTWAPDDDPKNTRGIPGIRPSCLSTLPPAFSARLFDFSQPAMTTRYRVEYALKTHRRDQLIEWIKGLLAVPFVLHSQPTAAYEDRQDVLVKMASTAHRRYAEILRDVCVDSCGWVGGRLC